MTRRRVGIQRAACTAILAAITSVASADVELRAQSVGLLPSVDPITGTIDLVFDSTASEMIGVSDLDLTVTNPDAFTLTGVVDEHGYASLGHILSAGPSAGTYRISGFALPGQEPSAEPGAYLTLSFLANVDLLGVAHVEITQASLFDELNAPITVTTTTGAVYRRAIIPEPALVLLVFSGLVAGTRPRSPD